MNAHEIAGIEWTVSRQWKIKSSNLKLSIIEGVVTSEPHKLRGGCRARQCRAPTTAISPKIQPFIGFQNNDSTSSLEVQASG